MKLTALMWAALTVVIGVSLFLLKYEVQALEDRLHATRVQIQKDSSAIRVLQAEWTYLNDPGRLRRLSEQHLGFAVPTQAQIISVSQIPFKNGEFHNSDLPDAVAPTPTPVPAPAVSSPAIVREAELASDKRVSFPNFQDWPGVKLLGFKTAAPDPQRPSALAALSDRFQRLLPTAWAGTPKLPAVSLPVVKLPTVNLQESPR